MAALTAALNIAAPVQTRAVSRRSAAPAAAMPVRSTLPATRVGSARATARVVASAAARPVNSVATESPATAVASEYEMATLTTWLLKQEQAGTIDNELVVVLTSIATACKQIASLVNRAGISSLTGLAGETNVQGEDQKKLDVISNEVFCSCLKNSGRTGIVASEEEDIPVAVEEDFSGKYIAVFDPLDGSSNIDAAVSTGSIFGIYNPTESCIPPENPGDTAAVTEECIRNVCQPGENLVSSGYCMYSSSTIMVLTIGDGVYGFTLDPLVGEFVMTHPNIKVPESGKIYSFNEGNCAMWSSGLQEYMKFVKDPEANGGKPYSARYIGSLVGDFHRTMLYGGVYGYPGDKKNVNGKLRLLYECAPMSFLAEQAGGVGSTGTERVLDIVPDIVHQRVPFFVGSKNEVAIIEKYLAEEK